MVDGITVGVIEILGVSVGLTLQLGARVGPRVGETDGYAETGEPMVSFLTR